MGRARRSRDDPPRARASARRRRRRRLPACPQSVPAAAREPEVRLRDRRSSPASSSVTVAAPSLTSQSPTMPDTRCPASRRRGRYPFGTTDQGYSVFAQVIYGGRISLVVAGSATLIAMAISITLGLLAAYSGGWIDDVINLVTNIFLVIPTLPLLIVISSFLKHDRAVVDGADHRASRAGRSRRGSCAARRSRCRNRDFILAAKVTGESTFRIVFGELMPNMLSRIAAGVRVRLRPGGLLRGGARVPRLRRRQQGQLGDDPLLGARTTRRCSRASGGTSSSPASRSRSRSSRSSSSTTASTSSSNPRLRRKGAEPGSAALPPRRRGCPRGRADA